MSRTQQIQQGLAHIRAADRTLRPVIKAVGPFGLRTDRNRFGILVRSIISQQISTSAARSIRARLLDRLSPAELTPDSLVRLSEEQLRAVGLSRPKASYLLDLARKAQAGVLRLERIGRLPDEGVIETLIQVKGIGRWTAEMFLIFSLGRLDVMPCDDLGVRSALRNLYQLKTLPDKKTCLRLAEPWRPYATIGAWYCWRSLDLTP